VKINKWVKIKIFKNEIIVDDSMKIGDIFLYGPSIVQQMEDKIIGNKITYYKIIGIDGNNIQYTPIYDVLEEI